MGASRTKLRIENREGFDYIINDQKKYCVRVYFPSNRPASYDEFTNQVVGVWYIPNGEHKILGLTEDSTIEFEFMGISLLNKKGYLKSGGWENVIAFYCNTKLGFDPLGYIAYNCDIA